MVNHWWRDPRLAFIIRSYTNNITNKKTVVVYSGPTSLDKASGKNYMYLKNMDYFLEHGVTCWSMHAHVDYIIVLTQDVATNYSSPDGPVTKKRHVCKNEIASLRVQNKGLRINESSIEIIVREDRCYDMESIWMVTEQKDLQKEYDYLLFVNCGLVGPNINGPHFPSDIHWTQVFTGLLTDSVRMSGLSMNPKPHPHIQSFLYAMSTETLQMMLSSGNIYDCQKGDMRNRDIIARYEAGMGQTILERGYSIAVPFMNNLEMGRPIIVNQNNLQGIDGIAQRNSDLWREHNLRRATSTMDKSYLEKLFGEGVGDNDILPWSFYMFLKVSRFVPYDVQLEMNYDLDLLWRDNILVIPNKCC